MSKHANYINKIYYEDECYVVEDEHSNIRVLYFKDYDFLRIIKTRIKGELIISDKKYTLEQLPSIFPYHSNYIENGILPKYHFLKIKTTKVNRAYIDKLLILQLLNT